MLEKSSNEDGPVHEKASTPTAYPGSDASARPNSCSPGHYAPALGCCTRGDLDPIERGVVRELAESYVRVEMQPVVRSKDLPKDWLRGVVLGGRINADLEEALIRGWLLLICGVCVVCLFIGVARRATWLHINILVVISTYRVESSRLL